MVKVVRVINRRKNKPSELERGVNVLEECDRVKRCAGVKISSAKVKRERERELSSV